MRRLLAAVLLLAACGTPAADVAAPATGTAAAAPTGVTEAPGRTETAVGVPPALDWTVDSVAGGQIDGGDLAGRDVVLWFWAPW